MELSFEEKKPDPAPLGYAYRVVDCYDTYRVQSFKVLRDTPSGFWIYLDWEFREKWVANVGKNNFAKRNKDEALENYYHRKLAHVRHIKTNLKRTEERLDQIALDLGKGKYKEPNVLQLTPRKAFDNM